MTREKAREAAEVMLAYANGEKIEQYDNYGGKWSEVKRSCCDFNWSKNGYRIKPKEKFDPNTLKPFDRVLVLDTFDKVWCCDLYSHKVNGQECVNPTYSCRCIGDITNKVIPYNEETKHLVGTNKEAPEYYRHWEK